MVPQEAGGGGGAAGGGGRGQRNVSEAGGEGTGHLADGEEAGGEVGSVGEDEGEVGDGAADTCAGGPVGRQAKVKGRRIGGGGRRKKGRMQRRKRRRKCDEGRETVGNGRSGQEMGARVEADQGAGMLKEGEGGGKNKKKGIMCCGKWALCTSRMK